MNKNFNRKVECYSQEERPFGFSFGAWTIKWWEWALSIPMSVNPVLDKSGRYADLNQDQLVWFLAGTIGDRNETAYRKCTIPKDRSILFPVINYIRTEEPLLSTDEALINHVQTDIDDIVVNKAFIDGSKVPVYRIKSEPLVFRLNVEAINELEIPVGVTRASADGYWVFIKALEEGLHDINFHGACSGGIRNASANYQITVI